MWNPDLSSLPDALPLSPHARVRLRPHLTLLHRDDGEIQLGWETSDAVVLADSDGSLGRLLDLLDGRYRLSELLAGADLLDTTPEELGRLLRALHDADLLDRESPAVSPDSRPPGRDPSTARVRLVGLGPVGPRIGDQLLQAGIGRLVVVDLAHAESPRARGTGHAVDRPRDARQAVDGRTHLDRAQQFRSRWAERPGRIGVANHWSKPDGETVDLTVVVAPTLEIDRAVVAGLTHTDQPHLLVRPRANGAVVGPLVVPGGTSCVRCADLRRSRADPAWPRMLAQLCRIAGVWHPVAADWAAAQATTQALGHLAGRTVLSTSATLELGPQDWSWSRRVWANDPACGCCWSPRAEW